MERVLPSVGRLVIATAAVFLLAAGLRIATGVVYRVEATSIQNGVAAEYKREARLLIDGETGRFVRGDDPPTDATILWHPQGYPLFVAAVQSVFGDSDAALQIVQALADALTAVLVMLQMVRWFSFAASVVAGVLVAISPQSAFLSQALGPDTLSLLPVVAAFACLAWYLDKRPPAAASIAGALIGISCWLRASWLLLPALLALVLVTLLPAKRLQVVGVMLLGFAALIAPMTVRNYVVFEAFIPVSLGGGLPMLEAIGQADEAGRFGIPSQDMEVAALEANETGFDSYKNSPWSPDGVKRDRERSRRALAIAKQNPGWYAATAARRFVGYLSPERNPIVAGVAYEPDAGIVARTTAAAFYWPQKILFSPLVLLAAILAGLIIAARSAPRNALLMLLAVPAYTLVFHSFFYFDRRYVVAIWYFLLPFSAVALVWAADAVRRKFSTR